MVSMSLPIKQKSWRKALIALAIVSILAVIAFVWPRSYLTLPEPVVAPPEVEGGTSPAVAAGLDKFDILLLGLDSRVDDPDLGDRTDTIMLVTIDPKENYARILSIPRDTRVRYNEKWHKINEVYTIDGAEGSVKAVEELLSMSIDRYVVADFTGVIELVDLLGGVTVDIPVNMYKPLENIDLKKGSEQHLNGYDALAYMRYRDEKLSDMDRSERQKEILLQLANKLYAPANITKLPSFAETAMAYIETNASTQEILALARFGKMILSKGVENQVLPGINDRYHGGWYYVPFLGELGLPIGETEKEYRAYLAEQEEIKKAEAERLASATAAAQPGETDGADADLPDAAEGTDDESLRDSTAAEASAERGAPGEQDDTREMPGDQEASDTSNAAQAGDTAEMQVHPVETRS